MVVRGEAQPGLAGGLGPGVDARDELAVLRDAAPAGEAGEHRPVRLGVDLVQAGEGVESRHRVAAAPPAGEVGRRTQWRGDRDPVHPGDLVRVDRAPAPVGVTAAGGPSPGDRGHVEHVGPTSRAAGTDVDPVQPRCRSRRRPVPDPARARPPGRARAGSPRPRRARRPRAARGGRPRARNEAYGARVATQGGVGEQERGPRQVLHVPGMPVVRPRKNAALATWGEPCPEPSCGRAAGVTSAVRERHLG